MGPFATAGKNNHENMTDLLLSIMTVVKAFIPNHVSLANLILWKPASFASISPQVHQQNVILT
jgi:hypothetical protein